MEIEELYRIFLAHPTVTTDSRDCLEGSIFFALKGESFDGNQYALSALDKGCSYAVIDDQQVADRADSRLILVSDVLTTLQQLARHHRRSLGTRVIGITGTNGKTTTKELITAVLARKYSVLSTQGNFNNHIGVPKTLLRLTSQHDIAVVEMGANHPGEIRTLVGIAEPDYGIITNVGKAHIEGFGSFEGVIRTKAELYDYLRTKPSASIFINYDNLHLRPIATGLTHIAYGTQPDAALTLTGSVTACDPYLRFTWQGRGEASQAVSTHLIGSYNIDNMLAAACIGQYFGVSAQQITEALAGYIPGNNRSQLSDTADNHLIIDAYNANPTSMMAALTNYRDMAVAPKMAILGDMRELGSISQEEHQRVVDFLVENQLSDVWLVGEEFSKTQSTFRKFRDVEEVRQALAVSKPHGYYILIKGSNGTRLHQLPQYL